MMGQNIFTTEALRAQRDCFFAHRETTMSKNKLPSWGKTDFALAEGRNDDFRLPPSPGKRKT